MSLELAVELRRLKSAEERLAILEREAAELTAAMIEDTRDQVPTATLRLLLAENQAEVRSAIQEWRSLKERIVHLVEILPTRRHRRFATYD